MDAAHHFRGFRPTVEVILCSVILLVTALHGLSYLLSDYTAAGAGAWWMILGYQGVLTAILAGSVYLSYRRCGGYMEPSARCLSTAVEDCDRFLPWLLGICGVGLVFHGYSKLALIGFYVPGCISELRQVWISTPHDQIPAFRRVTSVIGHLLASVAYAGVFFASYRYSIGVRRRASVFFASVFFLAGVAYAMFIGSQNAVLALLVVGVLAIGLGAVSVPAFRRGWGGRVALALWFATLAGFFSLFVFNNRVQCGGQVATVETFQQYERGFLDELPMKKKHSAESVEKEKSAAMVRELCPACNAIFIYLNHGIYNFQHIVEQKDLRGDPVFFNFFRGVAKRFGFPLPENPRPSRVYGLGGATLPGSAYHDFGWGGFLLVGLAHALLAIAAGALLRSGSLEWEGLGLVLYVVVGFVTALSLMFVGFNVISFPFVTISVTSAMIAIVVWVRLRSLRLRRLPGVEPVAVAAGGLHMFAPAQEYRLTADEGPEK